MAFLPYWMVATFVVSSYLKIALQTSSIQTAIVEKTHLDNNAYTKKPSNTNFGNTTTNVFDNTNYIDPDGSKQNATTSPGRGDNTICPYGNGSSLLLNSTAPQDFKSNTNEQECQNLFTRNAYKLDGCDAPDIESYLERHKSRFTCVDRCDQKPKYVGPTTKDCSCDALCVFYRDCCRDMPTVCPETYHRGQEVYSHLESAETGCLDTQYYLVYGKPLHAHGLSETTLSTKISHDTTTEGFNEFTSDPRTGLRVLRDYFGTLISFQVADITLSILYKNYAAFKWWRVPSSMLRFVPKFVTLECAGASKKSLQFTRTAQYLKSCTALYHTDGPSGLERSCPLLEVLNCHCGDNGEILRDLLGDSCQGQYNDVSLLKRNGSIPKYAYFNAHIPSDRECRLISMASHYEKPETKYLTEEDKTLEISIIPVVASNMSEVEEESDVEINYLSERENIYYVIEPQVGIERRFVCPSLDVTLSQCRLEQCTKGALLALNPGMPEEHFGRQCFLPKFAAVFGPGFDPKLPVCSCMRFMGALSGVWDVSGSQHAVMQCFLRLKMNEETIYNFHYLNKDFQKLFNLTAGSTVEESLQKFLNDTITLCPTDNIREFHVCFAESAAAIRNSTKSEEVTWNFTDPQEAIRNFTMGPRCEFYFRFQIEITGIFTNNETYQISDGPNAGANKGMSCANFIFLGLTLSCLFG